MSTKLLQISESTDVSKIADSSTVFMFYFNLTDRPYWHLDSRSPHFILLYHNLATHAQLVLANLAYKIFFIFRLFTADLCFFLFFHNTSSCVLCRSINLSQYFHFRGLLDCCLDICSRHCLRSTTSYMYTRKFVLDSKCEKNVSLVFTTTS